MNAEQSQPFETSYICGVAGLVGTVAVQVIDNQGGITIAPSTAAIIESPAGSGVYAATRTAPALLGHYVIVWSIDGTFDAKTNSTDDLFVYAAGADAQLPDLPPPIDDGSLVDGPCTAWTTDDEVINCCSADVGSADLENLTFAISQASAILWRLSGRRYSGLCQKSVPVRPCSTHGCGFQVLSRGHIIWAEDYLNHGEWGWDGMNWRYPRFGGCGCSPLDRIKLDGYPVREIIEVKIDGVIVPEANNWRLDRHRFLTRIADASGNAQFWPSCQRMDLADTELGTFSVLYSYGQDPPWDGMAAATQLACEIFKGCSGSLDCALPSGTVRITRQGITINRLATLGWLTANDGSGVKTGLSMVDAFVNSVNPKGLTRRPVIVTPGFREYPESVG